LRLEYENLRKCGAALRRATRGAIVAPAALMGTRHVLITELLDAVPVSALSRQDPAAVTSVDTPAIRADAAASRSTMLLERAQRFVVSRAVSRSVSDLYGAYGRMVLLDTTFHADPHPGNLLVPRRVGRALTLSTVRDVVPPPLRWLLPYAPPRLYLIDWGQCGGPTSAARRRQLAKLFLELADAEDVDFARAPTHAARVAAALRELGVVKGGAKDDVVEADMARGMFDSGSEIDLEDGGLQQGGIEVLPKDLCLVLRVTQMLRGLGSAAEMAGAAPTGNLAAAWRPYARRALSEPVST